MEHRMARAITLPAGSLEVAFLAPGQSSDFADGRVDHKTCPYTIVAEVLEGRYEVLFGRRAVSVKQGQAWLAPANTPLRIVHHHGSRGFMAARWVHFHATVYGAIDVMALLEPPRVLDEEQMAHIGPCIAGLLDGAGRAHPVLAAARHKELSHTILRAVCQASPLSRNAPAMLRGAERLAPVYRYVREHLADPIALGDLARAANLSSSRFHAVFKGLSGMSPMEYVKRMRLEEGRRLLCSSDAPIGRVAGSVGFANQFHFAREFKAGYGTTPRAFRRAHGGLVV
ncbi:MAG: helix-turn-helix domain-containing protein [Chitinivibrionales bacterium]|nr:helix-turn-helix domain-containing protein [Chitinivibrionales bacterium]